MSMSDTIASNMRSVMTTPQTVLPDGPARRWVFVQALAGHDVYIYRAAGSGVYNVWISGERLCLTPQGDETQSEFARWWADRFPHTPLVNTRDHTEGGAA